MFRCGIKKCNKVCEPRQPQHTIVTETRNKTYERKIFRGKRMIRTDEILGSEIIREVKVCPECYKEITGEEPRRVQEIITIPAPKEKYKRKRKPFQPRINNKKPLQVQRVSRKRSNGKTQRNP